MEEKITKYIDYLNEHATDDTKYNINDYLEKFK